MTFREELEEAAAEVIGILKGIADFSNDRVAVIGGLALWKYVPTGRTTQDIDFIISIDSAPGSVKTKLLALPNTPFVQNAQFFQYKAKSGDLIQVDIVPRWQSPYMPPAATKLRDIPTGAVPYIGMTDLLVFKIHSCGLRAEGSKKRRDALDAETIARTIPPSPIVLNAEQKALVEPCIVDVVAHGAESEQWWRAYLGLPASS